MQFLTQEDEAIIRLVNEYGTKRWTIISQLLNEQVHASQRSGKQCRERWHNHLDPNVRKENWTKAEDRIIFEGHLEVGNKWASISKLLPGRTDNSIKNHFYSSLRKRYRKLYGTDASNETLKSYSRELSVSILSTLEQKGNEKRNKRRKRRTTFDVNQEIFFGIKPKKTLHESSELFFGIEPLSTEPPLEIFGEIENTQNQDRWMTLPDMAPGLAIVDPAPMEFCWDEAGFFTGEWFMKPPEHQITFLQNKMIVLRRFAKYTDKQIANGTAIFNKAKSLQTEEDLQGFSYEDEEEKRYESNKLRGMKRKIDKTEEDTMEGAFWREEFKYRKQVRDYLLNKSYKNDPDDISRGFKTERIVRALQLNGDFDFNYHLNKKDVSQEYNNYDKYQLNYAEFVKNRDINPNDAGEVDYKQRAYQYITHLTPYGDFQEDRMEQAKDIERAGRQLNERVGESAIKEMIDYDLDEREDLETVLGADDLENNESAGRLSPHAKEDIYQLYNQGWTVNDISLKYGILPERVKAVVWQRRYFYQEIMPFIDRTTWRMALEREFLVAVEQQFQDYGLDLDQLALRKRGVPRSHVTENENDVAPSEDLKKKIAEWKKNLRPYLRYYFVTRKTVGKGTKAYKVKDWVIHRGNGRHSVGEMFKKVCYYSEKQPHRLPKKIRERLEEGPRIATRGYRMGSYTRSHIR